jgi:hypothetical protein
MPLDEQPKDVHPTIEIHAEAEELVIPSDWDYCMVTGEFGIEESRDIANKCNVNMRVNGATEVVFTQRGNSNRGDFDKWLRELQIQRPELEFIFEKSPISQIGDRFTEIAWKLRGWFARVGN